MAFYLNRENQFFVYDVEGKKWLPLKAGIYNWSESASYSTDETEYYDGDGNTTMDVMSISRDWTFQCHDVNDEAAEYVYAKRFDVGDDCRGYFKWTDTDGTTEKMWDVTYHDITIAGGAAGDKSGFEFQVHMNQEVSSVPA